MAVQMHSVTYSNMADRKIKMAPFTESVSQLLLAQQSQWLFEELKKRMLAELYADCTGLSVFALAWKVT